MENRSAGWELLGGLAIGAIGGFMLGMMVAPKSGTDTRERLGDSITDLRERTNDLLENVRGNTETLLNTTRQAIEEKMALLNEAVEAGRKAADYKRAELIEQEGT
jgi:gas vesicle protein